MTSLRPTYHWHLGLAGPAASAIQPPEDLRRQLAQQGQDIVDGNCGLDAFGLGLASVASRNQVLYKLLLTRLSAGPTPRINKR